MPSKSRPPSVTLRLSRKISAGQPLIWRIPFKRAFVAVLSPSNSSDIVRRVGSASSKTTPVSSACSTFSGPFGVRNRNRKDSFIGGPCGELGNFSLQKGLTRQFLFCRNRAMGRGEYLGEFEQIV